MLRPRVAISRANSTTKVTLLRANQQTRTVWSGFRREIEEKKEDADWGDNDGDVAGNRGRDRRQKHYKKQVPPVKYAGSSGLGTQACTARGIRTASTIATRKSAGTSPNKWPRSPASLRD